MQTCGAGKRCSGSQCSGKATSATVINTGQQTSKNYCDEEPIFNKPNRGCISLPIPCIGPIDTWCKRRTCSGLYDTWHGIFCLDFCCSCYSVIRSSCECDCKQCLGWPGTVPSYCDDHECPADQEYQNDNLYPVQ